MKKLLLLPLILFMGCGGVLAQRQDTIYDVPFTDASATGASGLITNIGQANHYLLVIAEDALGGTCASNIGDPTVQEIHFQGSWDNSAWWGIGPPIVTLYNMSGTEVVERIGARTFYTGAYPYLRVYISRGDFVNCVYSVYYSGSISGTFDKSNLSMVDQGFLVTHEDTLDITQSEVAGGSLYARVAVYGISITVGTGEANPPKDIALEVVSDPANDAIWDIGDIPADGQYILPMTGKPYVSTKIREALYLKNNGGAANCTTCTWDIIYRYE